ncbi:uncharacterized protein [Pagrus major]|uniref:uncharacterized protein n=1 Tax=Pagrus major TaxID=143350 RepID=UPI003CC885AE
MSLDAGVKTEDGADVQQLLVIKEEVEWSSSLDQEDPPELPHIKEEQEELWISQEGEQLGGLEEADITKFTFTPVTVKSEEDDEEKPQSSQLHQIKTEEIRDVEHLKTEADGEDCGGPEPAWNFNPDTHLQPADDEKTSHSSEPESDDSWVWEDTRQPRPALRNKDMKCIIGKTPNSSECATSFDNKALLKKQDVGQTELKPFSCSVCGKKYQHKKSLTSHMRIHSKEKRFSCPVCKKSFLWRGSVVVHMRTHTGEKPFSCSFCGTKFTDSSSLTKHLRVHTGEKPYSCSVCKKSTSDSSSLIKHMRIHTGEKPFSCSVCGKTFALQGTLRQHLTTHTGQKPFSCSVCDKKFTRPIHLRQHKCVGESAKNK